MVELTLDGPRPYSGTVQAGGSTYAISPLFEVEGTINLGEVIGYRVDGETPHGAVDLMRPGRAWFARGMQPSEHHELACIYAGLLLYWEPGT